jgi:hypothetical protein
MDTAALVVLSLAKIELLVKHLYEEHQIDSENRLETPRRIAISKRNVHNVLLHKFLKILEKNSGYVSPVQNFLHMGSCNPIGIALVSASIVLRKKGIHIPSK